MNGPATAAYGRVLATERLYRQRLCFAVPGALLPLLRVAQRVELISGRIQALRR